ncbi:MAG: radical SAM protein [Deltaproteobacteria bacterium]|nr:radical SAM protein [Deltaproteobacteria bacterium]
MDFQDTQLHVRFENSQEERDVPLAVLGEDIIDFLEHFGEQSLVGKEFCEIIGEGDGETRFARLLKALDYDRDPEGFFSELVHQLGHANSYNREPIMMNGVGLPHLLLVSTMEKLLPGNRYVSVHDVPQLEKLTNIAVRQGDRADLQQVMDTYPVRLSMHTVRQMRVSQDVAYQYLPFVEELDPVGHVNTWIGQFHDGLLEQMYRNRVIFLLNMSCPVYCRFCFRKHKESRNEANPTPEDVKSAVEYIARTPSIKEIVITGGDPFLNRANMQTAIDGLKEVPHVQTLRLATRAVSYYPHLFHADNDFWLNYLKMKNLELRQKGKRMELATHFIHPDEISPESLEIMTEMKKNGISVYIQTPFLKDCNDKGPELVRLFSLLRGAGAELHYIYIPCSPIHGNSLYWTTLSEGVHIANYLRAHLSDRVIPRITTATPIGKMDWYSSGWAVEPVEGNENFVWIRTPYDPAYYKTFAPAAEKQNILRVNHEGTIDVQYMAKIGDESLYLGSRAAHTPNQVDPDSETLEEFRAAGTGDRVPFRSIVETGSPTLFRLHETRVAMDAEGGEEDIEAIRKDSRITDVVIFSRKDTVESLFRIGRLIRGLQDIHHVNAVRLRSLLFRDAPEKYTRAAIEKLGDLNRLTVVNPLRLEIETEFLHSSEIGTAQADLFNALHRKGITVYANSPILGTINDAPDEINRIAYKVREIGMEYHHVYVTGHPLQEAWNASHPVDVADVVDIGTRVRRNGSGREIPRYIHVTELGEVDFGLTSRLLREDGSLRLKLLPYDLDYFRGMDPDFAWPEGVTTDDRGRPIVPVSGLRDTTGFMVGI